MVYIDGYSGIPDPNEPDEGSRGRRLFPTFKTILDLPDKPSEHEFVVEILKVGGDI